MSKQKALEHCPEKECVWYPEEHCNYWRNGKCTVTKDFLLITKPIWDKLISPK